MKLNVSFLALLFLICFLLTVLEGPNGGDVLQGSAIVTNIAQKADPGHYSNAWGDLNTTQHTWQPTVTTDPTSVDAPYSSY